MFLVSCGDAMSNFEKNSQFFESGELYAPLPHQSAYGCILSSQWVLHLRKDLSSSIGVQYTSGFWFVLSSW